MRRSRRCPDNHHAARCLDRLDPLREDSPQAIDWPVAVAELLGKRVAELAFALYLDRADLLQVTSHRRLGDVVACLDKSCSDFLLGWCRALAQHIDNGPLPFWPPLSHARLILLY